MYVYASPVGVKYWLATTFKAGVGRQSAQQPKRQSVFNESRTSNRNLQARM